jgi:hypothetical protein
VLAGEYEEDLLPLADVANGSTAALEITAEE